MSRLSKLRLGLAIACIAGAATNQLFDPAWVPLLASMASGLALSVCVIWESSGCARGRCDRE